MQVALLLIVLSFPAGMISSLYAPQVQGSDPSTSTSPAPSAASTSSPSPAPNAFANAVTYGTGLSGAPVILDAPTLSAMAGWAETVEAYGNVIVRYLQPMAVHLVFIDIGWGESANTTTKSVAGGYRQWIANWLTASGQYGIDNIFFTRQWGYLFSSPSWDQSFLNLYPAASTVNSLGVNVPLTSGCTGCTTSSGWTVASPLVYRQLERDLKQLYSWYGKNTNWVGFGEGATGDRNYYGGTASTIKTSRPFDNYTMSVFANSVFFQRNVNSASGRYADGALSKIWAMFLNDRPDISVSTGTALVFPTDAHVYGSNTIIQRFYVPFGTTLKGFALKAYLQKIGSPGTLYETVYRDNASNLIGRPDLSLTVQNVSVSGVTATPGWVSTSFTATLEGGDYYWVAFTTHGGGTSSNYDVKYLAQNVYQDIYPYIGTGGVNSAVNALGGSVLWLTTADGASVTVYPLLSQGLNQPSVSATYFQVTRTVRANEISLFTSDRAYDPNNITLSIKYPNGTVLTTGQLSEKAFHGGEGLSYTPVQLATTVTLHPAIKYQVAFSSLPASDTYAGSTGGGVTQDLITEIADPAFAGYLGQHQWAIFSVGLMTLEPQGISNNEYVSTTDLFSSPGYRPGSEIALRFLADQAETLKTFSFEVIGTRSTPGSFNVTLRADNSTKGSHPTSTKSYPVLAQGTQSFSTVNATFRACGSNTGSCAWVNVTMSAKPGGSLSLAPGKYYWLVIGATQLTCPSPTSSCNGYPLLNRDVNPRAALVYYSADDYAHSWGVPPDGPSDISFQITTTGQTISNLVSYQRAVQLGWMAQSFSSPTPFQLKGLWIYTSTSSVWNIQVSIRTDSGSDSPASMVLSSGTISSNSSSNTLNYASLNIPVNISANTKYWFVLHAVCVRPGTCSGAADGYALVYRSDAQSSTYGGSSLHYETSSNGATWASPSASGDMDFVLAASTSFIKTYNTKSLFNEIVAENDQATSYPPVGWNQFLNYQQAHTNYDLTQTISALAGRRMVWFTGLDTNVIQSLPNFNASYVVSAALGAGGPIGCSPSKVSCGGVADYWMGDATGKVVSILSSDEQNNELGWSSFGATLDNVGALTPTDLRTMYLWELPWMARNPTTFNDWSWGLSSHGLSNFTQTQYMRSFGTLLNRMAYNGGYFGTSKDVVSVLWIATPDDAAFPSYLSPAAHVTLASSQDSNLTRFGTLRQFNVIVNPQNVVSATASLRQRLVNFVKDGGGVVETTPPATGAQDNFLGLKVTSANAGATSTLSVVTPNRITAPYATISYDPYWISHKIIRLGNESSAVFLQDSNGNPVITANNYFLGRGVFVEQPYARLQYSDGNTGQMGDSFVSLMINAVFYAAHKDNLLPIVWQTSYSSQLPWKSLVYTVDGSPGSPLLWVSTDSSTGSPFDIHLNGTFYGVSTSGWMALDIRDMTVLAKGTGSDIHISTTIPPHSWLPIYLISSSPNLQPVYSTAALTGVSVGGSSGKYVASGAQGSSSWLILSSSVAPISIKSDRSGAVSSAYSTASAMNSSKIGTYCSSIGNGGACNSFSVFDQEGWYYDQSDSLLYIHYQSGNPVTISVSQGQSSSTSSSATSSTSTSITSSSSS